jgi:hypothetical protein
LNAIVQHIYFFRPPHTIAIVSGNEDLAPLITLLRDMGYRTCLMYPPGGVNEKLRAAPDEAFNMDLVWRRNSYTTKLVIPEAKFSCAKQQRNFCTFDFSLRSVFNPLLRVLRK